MDPLYGLLSCNSCSQIGADPEFNASMTQTIRNIEFAQRLAANAVRGAPPISSLFPAHLSEGDTKPVAVAKETFSDRLKRTTTNIKAKPSDLLPAGAGAIAGYWLYTNRNPWLGAAALSAGILGTAAMGEFFK